MKRPIASVSACLLLSLLAPTGAAAQEVGQDAALAEALDVGRALLEDAKSAVEGGSPADARGMVDEAIGLLVAAQPDPESRSVGELLSELGTLAHELGSLPAARQAHAWSLAQLERALSEDHADVIWARGTLATTLASMGDLAGARGQLERTLASQERTLPPDHPQILAIQGNLGATLFLMGELAAARELQERVLAVLERTLPEDHAEVLLARHNLANMLHSMGDFPGARTLQSQVLASRERLLPADHPHVLGSRLSLALTLTSMNDLQGARGLLEGAVAGLELALPEDHPVLIGAWSNLASALAYAGDHPGARSLQERALASLERTLPQGHLDILRARSNLAKTLNSLGDLAGARALLEAARSGFQRALPPDHRDLLAAHANLADTLTSMGDLAGARAIVPDLASAMLRRALAAIALSAREARQALEADEPQLAQALFLSSAPEAGLTAVLFELIETRRLVATEAERAASLVAADGQLAPLARQAADARARLNDLVAGAALSALSSEAFRTELDSLSVARDRAERSIRSALAERGVVTDPISLPALASALPEGTAAVGFLSYARAFQNPRTGRAQDGPQHLLAHVLRPDGALARVELGPAEDLQRTVEVWRAALGSPLTSRGAALDAVAAPTEDELAAGSELRRRLVDTLIAAAGGSLWRLWVCCDDLSTLVPLDALPTDGGRVGDRVQVAVQPSFEPLLRPEAELAGEPRLLALGGIDYGDPPRGGAGGALARLPGSGSEARAIGALFERAAGRAAEVVEGADASKSALAEHARGARYLHLATHGWFAPESARSILDEPAGEREWQRMGIEEQVTGFAPMTLCGLALAGANLGRDSLGRVPGILTAEELCSLDLSNCELAVLSACETNVGIRRAGQGIQSLQAALLAAGARTSITSLWKVDDAATRKLMELFYTYLWIDKLPKAEALWRAKTDLRSAGHPVRDWAGWVLTGDPG